MKGRWLLNEWQENKEKTSILKRQKVKNTGLFMIFETVQVLNRY